MYLYLI